MTRHGSQGVLDTASKGQLEDEFGTSRDEDVVQQILEKGTVVESEVCTWHHTLQAQPCMTDTKL